MYSGDENLSDAEQNPELEDQYDHDFEPEMLCENCGEDDVSCECDEDEQDFAERAECGICGMDENDPVHG